MNEWANKRNTFSMLKFYRSKKIREISFFVKRFVTHSNTDAHSYTLFLYVQNLDLKLLVDVIYLVFLLVMSLLHKL